MYIGDTGPSGLHFLVTDLVASSLPLPWASASAELSVTVELCRGGGCRVGFRRPTLNRLFPDGGGKPLIHPFLTVVAAPGGTPPILPDLASRLKYLILMTVNALSEHLLLEVSHGGSLWRQEYAHGEPLGELTQVGETTGSGLILTIRPDPTIFSTVEFSYQSLATRLNEFVVLHPGVEICLLDERGFPTEGDVFADMNGLAASLRSLAHGKTTIPAQVIRITSRHEGDGEGTAYYLDLACCWTSDADEMVRGFVNCRATTNGGFHLEGLRRAVTRTVNQYGLRKRFWKRRLPGADCRAGFRAMLSFHLPNPVWCNALGTHFYSPEGRSVVECAVNAQLAEFLNAHPEEAEAICHRALAARDLRRRTARAR
jgi:DNA gyrase subunit B